MSLEISEPGHFTHLVRSLFFFLEYYSEDEMHERVH